MKGSNLEDVNVTASTERDNVLETSQEFRTLRRLAAPHYDGIAKSYKQSETVSQGKSRIKSRFMAFMERNSFSSLVDLGCGSGVFAVIAKSFGLAHVVGVDVSPEQIALAESDARARGLDVSYHVSDISSFVYGGTFDCVSSVFGFCYARTKHDLQLQLKSASRLLNRRGKLFAVVCNPWSPVTIGASESYRVTTSAAEVRDGAELVCDFLLGGKVKATDCKYYWSSETWEACLRSSGFENVRWSALDESSTNIVLEAEV